MPRRTLRRMIRLLVQLLPLVAQDRDIACVVVDYDALRGIESDELTLF